MEWKIENRVFNNFVLMINFMEIMKSSFFNVNVVLVSLNWIKERNSQCKNIQNIWLQLILILIPNSSFSGIKKCKKFSRSYFLLVLILLILFISLCFIIFRILGFVITFFSQYCFRWLYLNSQIAWLFLVPKYWHWNFLYS